VLHDLHGHRAPPSAFPSAGMNVRAERRMGQGARPPRSASAWQQKFDRARQASGEPPSGVPPRAGLSSPALYRGWRPPPGGAGRMKCTARARESATGFALAVSIGKRSSCEPAPTNGRAACCKNNGMDLVDWTGQVSSSGEQRPSGERCPLSFRLSSIKIGARTPAKPAPQRDRCPSGEWFGRIRLEQRWGPGHNLLWAGARTKQASAPGINARRLLSCRPLHGIADVERPRRAARTRISRQACPSLPSPRAPGQNPIRRAQP
jgi:hypothetical protein